MKDTDMRFYCEERNTNRSPIRWLARILLALLTLGGLSVSAGIAQELAVTGGHVIPIDGDPIENGTVLIKDGKIVAVGKADDVKVPIEARVVDASGKTVLPGFIDVHNSSGMSQSNERNSNVPFLSVVDSIDPSRTYFEECRRNGVTTAAVVPGNSTMIGGQAAIIKSAGGFVDDMILKRAAGIKISLRPASGSRMSQLAKLRKELDAARKAEEDEKESEKKDAEKEGAEKEGEKEGGKEGEKDDDKQEESKESTASSAPSDKTLQINALRKLLRGELPAFVYCENGMDVHHALALIKRYELKAILVLGEDCYKAVDLIAKSELPVVLDPTLVFWQRDPRTGKDEKIVLPELYHKKEVPMTFQVSSTSSATLGTNYLWYQAATAVKYGLTREEALRAITLRPAEVLGIADFVGSLTAGKDADLVILTGDPLKVDTWVDQTIVGGEVVYERDKDEKLKLLLDASE